MTKLTPVRRQYLKIKQQYPDAIVLFRLGDFYETFDEDARTAARELDLVLTSRPVSKGQRVPMAGVPHHAVEGYIARLISKGYKVAICEQVSDEPVKGLMTREVVRVVTPGTVVEPALLDERRNNYLAAVVVAGESDRRPRSAAGRGGLSVGQDGPTARPGWGTGSAGLAYVDITTGEFATTQLQGPDALTMLREELNRLQPAECLVPAGDDNPVAAFRLERTHLTPYEPWRFELDNARQALLDHFQVTTLEGYGCSHLPMAVRAAGAIVQYLRETQKGSLAQITQLATYSTSTFMTLDAATRRNLELTQTIRTGAVQGSLLGVLDQACTPMGGRLLRQWLNQPQLDITVINERLDAVEALYQATMTRGELREHLKRLGDLERLCNRVVQGIAGPRDLLRLRQSLEEVPNLADVLLGVRRTDEGAEDQPGGLAEIRLDPCQDVVTLIAQAISEEAPATLGTPGVIAPGFSAELDGIHAAVRDAKRWVAGLERRERERTGIKSLKVGYNKVFGYYIEVTKANADLVPGDYIRKQTLVNAERYITPELKEYEALILNAEERITELEARIFRQVCEQVAAARERIMATARSIAHLDVYTSLAEVAVRNRYVRPRLTAADEIHIIAGRHPVVELTRQEEPFVPNDLHLADGEIIVLTGPNMSGKSTFLRQVAIIVLMAQIGSFVPADEATIGVVDRIFTRIGAQDEIAAGQSTFMVEMIETANILNHATPRSLVILDEIGRGTSTYDGISIAWAVVEYLHNHPRLRPKTLFATHYHELTELANFLPRVKNYNVAVAEEGDQVVFLHRIEPGGADRSYGIHVAQLAGLPRPVIHRAEEILEELEREARAPGQPRRIPAAQQLPLFPTTSPVLEELKKLDLESMTPLEALNKLYELQQKVRG